MFLLPIVLTAQPIITIQPVGQTVGVGDGTSFNVTAAGDAPLAFQWRFNGTNIDGATNASLMLLNVQMTNVGNYSVLVTNSFGSTTSFDAQLNVYLPGLGVQTVSAPGAVDMVYDGARDLIYITSGSSILRYHVGSNVFLTPFVLGSGLNLWHLDISYNCEWLVAANDNTGTSIYVLNLHAATNLQVVLPPSPIGNNGTYSVAFGSDNAVLVTGDYTGSNWAPMRRYDVIAGTNSLVATVFMRSMVTASGDGSVICANEGEEGGGNLHRYSVPGRAVTKLIATGRYSWVAPAVNQNGTQFACATDEGAFIYNSNLTQIATIGIAYSNRPVGIVYHPTNSLMFLVWGGSSEVRVHDTTTMLETARYDLGTAFSSATGTIAKTGYRTRISRDGSLLMVNTSNAVKYLRWAVSSPQISMQPTGITTMLTSNVLFSVEAVGNGPFTYQWQYNGLNLGNATNATLALTNVQYTHAGGYGVTVFNEFGFATSSVASLTVNGPPIITNQPQSQVVLAGTNVTFTVGAEGTQPFGYQWIVNQNQLIGTGTQLDLTGVQALSAGDYFVILNNGYGSATSAVATLTVNPSAPVITQPPTNQTVGAGTDVTMSVTRMGTEPISCQWFFNGDVLPGQIGTQLVLSNVQASHIGSYSAVLSNSLGTNLSAAALLTVTSTPPTFIVLPSNVTAIRGAEVTFTGVARGSEPIGYIWQVNFTNIVGATNPTLVLTNVQSANTGVYRLIATNDYGTNYTGLVSLTVTPPPGFLWARKGGSTGNDAGKAVATDAAGNIFVAGDFVGTATFAGTNLTNASAGQDVFVAKYDAAGQLLWARSAGGAQQENMTGVATDPTGNVLVAGYFASSVMNFGSQSITNIGTAVNIFVAKYDAEGNVIWARGFGGTGHDQAAAIACDSAGNVFLTGNYYNTVDFGPVTLPNAPQGDVFTLRLDSDGNVIWAKQGGGSFFDSGHAIALDQAGNVLIAGTYGVAAVFSGVLLTNISANQTDLFVVKYDSGGNLLWARQAGGLGTDVATAIAADLSGNIFVTGYFNRTSIFDTISILPVGVTSQDMFVAKYNSAGAIQWVKSGGGTSTDAGNGIAVDSGGNAYVAGKFASSATFGTTNVTGPIDEAFVAAYSAAGNVLWVRKAGGGGSDNANAVALDPQGNACLVGSFMSSSATFGHVLMPTTGSSDAFLAKLATVDPLAPPSFTLQPSNQIAQAGANITLSPGFVGTPPIGFQWLLNGTNLAGATNAALTLSNAATNQAGNYSVIVANANGAVTSVVATVTVSIEPDFLWALGGGSSTNDEILGVVCDTNGNSYVAGYFSGTLSLAGTNLVSTGGEDVIVAKFDSTTNLVWAVQAGGVGNDRANCIALDPVDGSVLVAGQFSGSPDFHDPTQILTSAGGSDLFLADFNTNGSTHWVRRGGGTGDDAALGVAISPNARIFVTGTFQGSATIAGAGLTSAGSNDMFLAQYDRLGNGFGARSGGGTGDDRGRAVACDGAGNVFVAGAFASAPASFSGTNLTSNAGYDAFVVKYDSSMNRIWARKAGTAIPPAGGGVYNDEATAIVATPDNGVFVVGYFNNRAAFGTFTNTTASTNLPDAFLAKYDGNGNVLWVKQAGGTNSETATALATDFGGNAYLAGWVNGPAQFGPASVTNVGGTDAFVAMYDAAGGLLKVRRAGGVGDDAAQAVAADRRGNVVIGGTHGAPAAFGGFAVANLGGKDAFAAKVSVFAPDLPPVITSQPAGASTTNGLSVSLAVGVSSDTPVRYQWFFNGSSLVGATNGTLNLTNVQYANLGSYFVIASNGFGVVTSGTAVVRIELSPLVLWTAKHGGTGDDQGLAVAVDATTNVYVAGIFSGTVAFGTSNLVSSGGTDIFFAKYNSAGGLVWVRKYGGSSADTVSRLVLDSAGNIFMAGSFNGTAFIGGTNLVSAGAEDCFLCKHDSAGNFLWAQRGGGNMPLGDRASGVATDTAGNIYITGSYGGGAAFGSVSLTNQNSNWTNFFLVKYGPNGNALWGRAAVGTNTHGNGVTVDATGNVYVTGFIGGAANFGSGLIVNSNNLAGGFGNGTVFIAKYDANGTLQWAKKGGTDGLGYGQNVAVDVAGNLFGTSYKRDYGGGVTLTKYDGSGNRMWVRSNTISCCTGDYISVNGLALDAGGNPLLAGGVTGSANLEGLSLAGAQQGFIVKYRSSEGTPYWIFKSGQLGYAAAIDASGNTYVAGRFSGTTLFGTSSNLVSSGGNDAFLVKFGVPAPTITSPPTDQFIVAGSNSTLQVATTGASATYQWLLNGTNIPGATGSSYALNGFNAFQSGRYSVIVQSASGWTTSSVAGVSLIPVLSVAAANEGVVLNWDGTFTLQSASSILGPYADLMSGVGPVTNPIATDELERYFRLRQPSPYLAGMMGVDGFALTFTGSPGRRYAIEASTNLLNWTPLATDVFPFTLRDTNAAAEFQKYYRARSLP